MIGEIDGSVNNAFQVNNAEMRVTRVRSSETPGVNGTGSIDQVEFSPLAAKMSKGNAAGIGLEQAPPVYDSDESGKLGKSDFTEPVSKLPHGSGDSDGLNRLFQKYDEDGDGELSLVEFRTFLSENVFPPPTPSESRGAEQSQETLDVEG